MCFSSHSEACGEIASAVNLTAISWIWRWSSVRSNWVMAGSLAHYALLEQELQQFFVMEAVGQPLGRDTLHRGDRRNAPIAEAQRVGRDCGDRVGVGLVGRNDGPAPLA